MKDPIVEEVRRFRHEHELRFGQDLQAILDDIRHHQAGSALPMVRLSPKRIAADKRRQRTASRGL